MTGRWDDVPRWVRAVVWTTSVALLYGTAVHLSQLVTGTSPSAGIPSVLALYFASLVLFDPAAAVLLLRRTRTGILLAGSILVTDAAANAYVNYGPVAGGPLLGKVAPFVIGALALLYIYSARRIWPTHRP